MISALLVAGLALAAAVPSDAPKFQVLDSVCEFALAHPWTTVDCDYQVANDSTQILTLRSGEGTGSILADSNLPVSVNPGGRATIQLTYKLGGAVGQAQLRMPVDVSEGKSASTISRVYLVARGYVYSELDDVSPQVNFGVVDAGQTQARKVAITSHDLRDLRVLKVLDAPGFVNARVGDDGKSVLLSINPKATWGVHDGMVNVALNSKEEPEAGIKVQADVHGKVVPGINPVDLGIVRKDSGNETLIRLNDLDGKEIGLGRVALEGFKGHVQKVACTLVAKDCVMLKLHVSDDQSTGMLDGTLNVELPSYGQQLNIVLRGALFNAKTKIVNLNELSHSKEDANAEGTADSPPRVSLEQALNRAVKEAVPPPADPAGEGPVLRWRVQNQSALYGYLVYRSNSADGPFLRVNKSIIHTNIDDDSASSYAWRDTSAVAGKTYWYRITTLYNNGTKKPLSSPQKVVAK